MMEFGFASAVDRGDFMGFPFTKWLPQLLSVCLLRRQQDLLFHAVCSCKHQDDFVVSDRRYPHSICHYGFMLADVRRKPNW